MTCHIVPAAAWCVEHAPVEVEYVCSSVAWSALWFVLGWITTIAVVILIGDRK